MFYRLQFINSPRFMTSLLLNPVNNLSKGVYKVNCKNRHDGKNSNICWIKYKYCNYFLEYTFFKDGLIKHKYLCCNKNYKQKFDEKLKERFFNTFKFSNYEKRKFVLLLRKGIYPYEYKDDWERFYETILPEKEDFYSHLSMDDINDADCAHSKMVWKILK